MTKDITLTIETPGLFMQATYECRIFRDRKVDDAWLPDMDPILVRVDMVNSKDEEFEWFYGDNKPSAIVRALELHGDRLNRLLLEKATDIVNAPNFQDNPHEDDRD